jgi:hypothetical protein
MISGLVMGALAIPRRYPPACKTGRPAGIVPVARLAVLEIPVFEHEAGAAGRRLEIHRHLGVVAARAACVFPGPAEHQEPRRLDDAVDAAHRHAIGGAAQDNAPAAAGLDLEGVDHGLVSIRSPPSDEFGGLDPQREQSFRRRSDQPFEP